MTRSKTIPTKIYLLLGFLCLVGLASAQQLHPSIYQFGEVSAFNPGRSSFGNFHQLTLLHLQYGRPNDNGFSRKSTHFLFTSAPSGRSKRFSWGIWGNGWFRHTEGRLGLNANMSVKFIETDRFSASTGVSFGFINWQSNYNHVVFFHNNDPVLGNGSMSTTDLDAGLGLHMAWRTRQLSAELGGALNQLPGNLLSNNLPESFTLHRNLNAYASFLAEPAYNFKIGPSAIFRNDLFKVEGPLPNYTVELGLQARMSRQNMRATLSYRMPDGALNFLYAIALIDTAKNPQSPLANIGMTLGATYPMAGGWPSQPGIELGLQILLRPQNRQSRFDSLRRAAPIWRNNGNLTSHMEKYLRPFGPFGLICAVDSSIVSIKGDFGTQHEKSHKLTYTFPDYNDRYLGDDARIDAFMVERIGGEWEGVDGLLNGLAFDVVDETLYPDKHNVLDQWNLVALDRLLDVEISSILRPDEEEAKMGADVQYFGEFGHDTLRIPIVFSGRDTVVKMIPGQYLSELEFSALKLYVVQQKLKFELRQYYGEDLLIRRESETSGDFDFTRISRRSIFVLFKKLRIQPDNRNLKGLHKVKIDLRFAATKQKKRTASAFSKRELRKRKRRQAKVKKWQEKGLLDENEAASKPR
ncbi:MAG: type IX secretion system membrane protein PorP/SprF [Bacteroidota bacterium]